MEDLTAPRVKECQSDKALEEIENSVGLMHFNQDGLSDLPRARPQPVKIRYTPTTVEEFELLRTFDFYTLIDMGCRIWTRTEWVTVWLFPVEWYDYIPEGMSVITLGVDVKPFYKKDFPKDPRIGLLNFGFYQALH